MNQLLRTVFSDDPAMLALLEQEEQTQLLRRLTSDITDADVERATTEGRARVSMMKQLLKLREQMLKEELAALIEPLIPEPVPGKDGEKGEKGNRGDDGKDGKTPSTDQLVELIKPLIPEPLKPEDGKDAEIDTQKLFDDFIKKIRKEKAIDISQIRNAESFMFGGKKYKTEELLHGGGPTLVAGSGITITSNSDGTTTLSATGATIASETPVGAVDGVNTTYTVSHTPLFIIADSNFRVSGQGYTYSAPTITMDPLIPPVTFIRSYYAA